MNILLFVTSMMMILSILTYARIDSFRYFTGMQSEFERYMRNIERAYPNTAAKQWYDTTIANKRGTPQGALTGQPEPPSPAPENTESPNPPPKSTPSSPRLSFRILIDPQMRQSQEKSYVQIHRWAKNLIETLYKNQPFYKEMLQKHPTFLDDLLARLQRVVEELPENQRPTQTNDLSNLSLGSDLEDAFYLMLKGCSKGDLTSTKHNLLHLSEAISEDDKNPEDETDNAEEALEYSTGNGYNSLLNYITLKKITKIRVYLASRELLSAIFGSTEIADNIIKYRYDLYRSVMGGLPPDQAKNQFQSMYQSSIKGDDESLLDFKVTKTNPSEYD